jgi:hypothetical protein
MRQQSEKDYIMVLPTDCVIPQGEGFTIEKMIEVMIEDIIRPANARATDLDFDTVRKFEVLIETNRYWPKRHEPPMVVWDEKLGKYVLKTGNHRYTAHKGTGQKTMWVAVITYASPRSEIVARHMENAEENEIYIKHYRSLEDILKTASELLSSDKDNKGIPITESAINKIIKELKADKRADYDVILSTLKKNSGIRHGVTTYSKDEVEAYIASHSTDNSTPIVQLFRTVESAKADDRMFFNVLEKKVQLGADAPITVYGHFTRLPASKVYEGRKNRVSNAIFNEKRNKYINYLSVLTNPNWTNPDQHMIPQVDGVEINVE